MSLTAVVKRVAATLTIAGIGLTGLYATPAEPAPAPPAAETAQPGAPICPVQARTVFEFSDSHAEGDHVVSRQAFLKGDTPTPVTPGTPTGDSAQFLGWYYLDDKGNVTEQRFDPAAPDASTHAVSDGQDTLVRIGAKYSNSHLVRFYNDNKALAGSVMVPDGESVNLTRDGEEVRSAPTVKSLPASGSTAFFAGWSTTPTGEADYDLNAPVTRAQDLYAKYAPGYVVTFDTKGGSFVPVRTVRKGQKLDLDTVDTPKREGYRFKYWALDGTTQRYDENTVPTGSFTLDAVWEPVEVGYSVVFMRETTEGGTYEIDSFAADRGLTESVAYPEKAIAAKQRAGGITEMTLVAGAGEGGDNTIHFVYNEQKTRAEKVTIAGSGETVKRVYFDRPRYTLTYRGDSSDPRGHNYDVVKKIDGVIAGAPTAPYAEEFAKELAQRIKARGLGPQDSKWNSDHSYKDTPEGRKFAYFLGYKTEGGRAIGFILPPKMPGRNFDLTVVAPVANPEYHYVHYVEVHRYGAGRLWIRQRHPLFDPDNLVKYSKVLKHLIDYKTLLNDRINLTKEDYVPILGFTTIERREQPGRRYSIPDEKGEYHWVIRYIRNSYPVALRANGGPGGDSDFSLPYQASLKEALASTYVVDKTTRTSDGAVFKGWYDNENFLGEPYNESDTKMPAHGLVLYAKWGTPEVKVNYHSWDRDNPTAAPITNNKVYDRGAKLTELVAPEVPQGQDPANFLGWYYISEDGRKHPFRTGRKLLRDYEVYPRWPSPEARVRYHTGEGTGSAPDTGDQVTYRNASLAAENAPDLVPPAGKVFLGWRVRGGDNATLLPGQSYEVTPVDEADTVHLDPVFGPQPPQATLTYLPNGGQGQPVTQTHPDYAKATVAAADTFRFPGHRFKGWGASPQGPAIECGPGSKVLVPPGASRLYALWEDAPLGGITVVKVGPAGEALDGAEFGVYPDIDRQGAGVPALADPSRKGTFQVDGLEIGREYFLAETRAPKGHELMPVAVGFTLGEDGTVALSNAEANPNISVAGRTITVADVKAGHLPATGGPGHLPYYIAALVLFAAAIAATKRSTRTGAAN